MFIEILIKTIASFFASFFFAIVFNTAKKELFYCGLTGALGWLTYLIVLEVYPQVITAYFFGALMVGILSTLLAQKRRAPVTVFLVSGIIPLVPGKGMYDTMYAMLERDFQSTFAHLITTIQIAGAIAIAMALPLTFIMRYYRIRTAKNKK